MLLLPRAKQDCAIPVVLDQLQTLLVGKFPIVVLGIEITDYEIGAWL